MVYASIALISLFLLLIVFFCLKNYAKTKQLEQAFFQRETLSQQEFYQRYFTNTDVSYAVVIGVIEVLESCLDMSMSTLNPADDFTKNLRFFWDIDSLADVEILCALEKKFNIKISESEAEQMVTVNDMMRIVAKKML